MSLGSNGSLHTELGYKVGPRLRECCKQSQAEVASKSRDKIHQTWVHLLAQPCTSSGEATIESWWRWTSGLTGLNKYSATYFAAKIQLNFGQDNNIQRSPLFCANIVKRDPGRARQNGLAAAGANFIKPGAHNKGDLCTGLG